jgi:hypothetical protein
MYVRLMSRRRALAAIAGAAAGGLASLARSPDPARFAGSVGGIAAAHARGTRRTSITVQTNTVVRPISPRIYGVAGAGPGDLAATGARLNRWGGNPSSRYNWVQGNAWNSGRDWEFRNGNYGNVKPNDLLPSGVTDRFVGETKAAGADTLITLPAVGWVARNTDNATQSLRVPAHGGPPAGDGSDAIGGYDPSENRRLTSVRSLPRKNAPFADPAPTSDPIYQDEWVNHLVRRFGAADQGGVRFYAVDNEPDLWSELHTDVHPVQPGYDDMLATFLQYSEAIKDVDSSALVLGPSVSGWTGYFYSARDLGADKFRTHADRRAHGDMPFLAWFLSQVRQHDEALGRRTLDLLDVHHYPQAGGVYAGATDDEANVLRLRTTRSLWDGSYTDESWIGEPVKLIPRLREWVEAYYPGTGLALGEWNWGADTTINGGLAVAEVLGILGREGVDLAAYWGVPPRGSPGALAFQAYTNFDGAGATFGNVSVPVQSDAPEVAAFASRHTDSGDVVLVIVNERRDTELPTDLLLRGVAAPATGRTFGFSRSTADSIRDLGVIAVADERAAIVLPPSSVTIVQVGSG